LHGRDGRHVCKPVPQQTPAPPGAEQLLLSKSGPAVEDDDSDTGEKPPLAAFEGPGVGSREAALGPLSAPPLPPRRDEFDATYTIPRRR